MAYEKEDTGQEKGFLWELTKYSRKKKGFINECRRLIITIGLFAILQIAFIMIDGTFLEPNSFGNFVSNIAGYMEWVPFYSNPAFQFVSIIAVLHILYVLLKTVAIGFIRGFES